MRAQMTIGDKHGGGSLFVVFVLAVVFGRLLCVSLNTEQSDRKPRMNFNNMEMKVLVGEVNTHSVEQRNTRNNRCN